MYPQGGISMKTREGGFTLIGMLVAVAIIGVLAMIAVPKFTNAITSANTAKVQADLSTIDAAVATYRIDKGSDPGSYSQLKGYIRDFENVKPPKGKVYLNGGETDIKDSSYSLKKFDNEMRATLDDHTLNEFGKNNK